MCVCNRRSIWPSVLGYLSRPRRSFGVFCFVRSRAATQRARTGFPATTTTHTHTESVGPSVAHAAQYRSHTRTRSYKDTFIKYYVCHKTSVVPRETSNVRHPPSACSVHLEAATSHRHLPHRCAEPRAGIAVTYASARVCVHVAVITCADSAEPECQPARSPRRHLGICDRPRASADCVPESSRATTHPDRSTYSIIM